MPWYAVTPFAMDHTVIRPDGSLYYSGSCCPKVFRLVNTGEPDSGAAVYCLNPAAGLQAGTGCRRSQLEDANTFDADTAGRIRAVVLHAYPYKTVRAVQARANAWLRRQGLPEIVDLQSGEAILAAQAALWKLACGDRETIRALYAGTADMGACLGKTVDTETLTQQETPHTPGNVESLYTYLTNLAPEEPRQDTASEAGLENPACTWVKGPNGTYNGTASVTVNTTVGPRDSLMVTASCGDQTQTRTVTGAGECCFTFRNMPQPLEVELELRGRQSGGDVYLFEAEGSSQALVGYDDSCLQVCTRITVSPDRCLPSAVPESNTAQMGIQLDVSTAGCRSASFAVGQSHSWIIRSSIPEDLRSAQGYAVTGVIDSRLTYEPGSPSVCLYTRAGDPVPLRLEDHYLVEEVDDNFFRVSLTRAGMAYVTANLGTGQDSPELHVRFRAVINETASLGQRIPNMVHLTYTAPDGTVYEADSGISEVHTGGLFLWNTDAEDACLPGAVFRLAREATQTERSDPSVETTRLNVDEEIRTVVYVPFYASEDLNGGQVWEVTADADGRAALCGLAYGSYYLVQIRPSDGYILETRPISVTVDGNSHRDPVKLVSKKIHLPQTGGMGTGILRGAGAAILASAAFLLFTNRKRKTRG